MSTSQILYVMDRAAQKIDNAVINGYASQAGQYGEALTALVELYRIQLAAECPDCKGQGGSIETLCGSRTCAETAGDHTHPAPCPNRVTHR
ncbi:hypothetical protein [Streptomyces sp. NPDC051993]|uniref:hypothetical protein n=1 Tax=Streptomyces sp. NPDC051993 TaxID=3155286 RepID=UPI003426F652